MSDNHLVLNSDGCIEYIPFADGEYPALGEEAAGKVFKRILPVVAAIFIPFAAPVIASSIGLSGAITGMLGGAVKAGFISQLGATLGSAIVGGAMNAAVAYASGARGGAIWAAAGMGALTSGFSGYSAWANSGTAAAAGAQGVGVKGGLNAVGGVGPVPLTPPATTPAPTSAAPTSSTGIVANTQSAGLIDVSAVDPNTDAVAAAAQRGGLVSNVLGRAGQLLNSPSAQRALAALTMGVGGDDSATQALIAQRQAELAQLSAQDHQRQLEIAKQIYAQSQATDPAAWGRQAMADMQFAMNQESEAAQRERLIDPYSSGRQKSDERKARLAIGREKSRAYQTGHAQGTQARTAGLTAAYQAFTPYRTDFELGNELASAGHNATQARGSAWRSAAGLLLGGPPERYDQLPTGAPAPRNRVPTT